MNDVPLVITVDGPAGSGKSTVAKALANRLGLSYLDTGALYRAIAWYLNNHGISAIEGETLTNALEALSITLGKQGVRIGGHNVTSLIRSPEVDGVVSSYAALPSVRRKLLDLQRRQALLPGIVADGRDMGTVVFPCASCKFFLIATPEIRAQRRVKEIRERGETVSYQDVLEGIRERDRIDSEREEAPLRKPENSFEIDTSGMSIEEVVSRMYGIVAGAVSL